MIPPEPGPDPPEPEPGDYTFSITNHMNQSFYFRAAGLQRVGNSYEVVEWSEVSPLINMDGSVNLTVPQGYTVYRLYYKASSDISASDYFRVYIDGTSSYNISPVTGKETFTVQYYGNNASTVGVWS